MTVVSFVVVEAAVELVPKEIWEHPAVRSYARRRGKKPGEVLLDRAYHHAAMKGLPRAYKRGRPDITHFILLEVLGSPLNRAGMLETYVETQSGHLIHIHPETRLPRIYARFKGVIEKLYKEPLVEAEGKVLLRMERGRLERLIKAVKPDVKILLSEGGERMEWDELGERIASHKKPMIMIGGFPRGDFEEETRRHADCEISIWHKPLEAWTVSSRILCALERVLLKP